MEVRKQAGTLGTNSTAVTGIPQELKERKVVPMPKQITRAFCGGRSRKTIGRCAIILAIGVSIVMP